MQAFAAAAHKGPVGRPDLEGALGKPGLKLARHALLGPAVGCRKLVGGHRSIVVAAAARCKSGAGVASAMLDRARAPVRDARAQFQHGDAIALRFDDETFDVVLALWVLETLPDPLASLRECLRVLRPEGMVIAAFSSRPQSARAAALAKPAGAVMQRLFAGRFPPENERPLHACAMSCTHRYDYGYVTIAVFGKRCQLAALPALTRHAPG
jgi:SAM-dependent methyltransferase